MSQSSYNSSQADSRKRTGAGCGVGCAALVVTGVILLGLGIGVLSMFNPNAMNSLISGFTGEKPVQTRPLQGDPTAFDPIAQFDELQDYAGADAQLVAFDAYYVRADGTMDLTADYNPRVEAEFLSEVPRPDNAPPPGVAGSGTGPWSVRINVSAYRPGQARTVTQMGGVSSRYTYVNDGMTREEDEPATNDDPALQPPRCSLRDMWRVALTKDAPADAVAIIRYDEDGYNFNISGVGIHLEFTPDCKLVN